MTPPQELDQAGSATDRPVLLDTTEIVAHEAALECSLVPWDSKTFGFAVAQITRIDIGVEGDAVGLFQSFEAWCADRDVRLVSCRLDHERLRESMALEDDGFRFVEMVYRPRRSLEDLPAPDPAINVAPASPSDLASIESIAYDAFSTGRYFIDRRLPPDLSQRRYASWVASSFEAPNQAVLKAEMDGDLVGFFIVEHRPDGSVYWHLTAIAPSWQGKGVGLNLWKTMLLRHRSEGATFVETTISAHNTPALNLYARLGFTFSAAQMTFHRLRDSAGGGDRAG